jgi:hypothetical protein
MLRREKIERLLSCGYIPGMRGDPDTKFTHPEKKMYVWVHYGGSVSIWYNKHPKHITWDGLRGEFVDRREK